MSRTMNQILTTGQSQARIQAGNASQINVGPRQKSASRIGPALRPRTNAQLIIGE